MKKKPKEDSGLSIYSKQDLHSFNHYWKNEKKFFFQAKYLREA